MFSHRKSVARCFLLSLFCLFCYPGFLGAQETGLPLVPSPSVMDFTRGEGWAFALGIGIEYESAYDGSDEYELEVEPAGAIQWRTGNHLLFWEGIEIGWRGRLSDQSLLQLGLRYESGREEDDSDDDRLAGLEDQDNEIVAVLEGRWSFDPEWRNWVAGRFMGGDSSFGFLGVLAAGHRFGSHYDGTGTEIYLFTTFGDSDFLNRDFGVTASESLDSGLEETDLSSGYRSVGISLIDRRYLTKKIHLMCKAGIEYYSSDIQDSPIARQDYEAEAGVSVVYHF